MELYYSKITEKTRTKTEANKQPKKVNNNKNNQKYRKAIIYSQCRFKAKIKRLKSGFCRSS